VIVEAADVELQAPFPRPGLLEALAEGSGGRFSTIDEDLPELEVRDTRKVNVDRSRRVSIWDTWPMFLGLLALAGAEWWQRRRAGLL
jgi:MYXO-CTERM domain-containing protein